MVKTAIYICFCSRRAAFGRRARLRIQDGLECAESEGCPSRLRWQYIYVFASGERHLGESRASCFVHALSSNNRPAAQQRTGTEGSALRLWSQSHSSAQSQSMWNRSVTFLAGPSALRALVADWQLARRCLHILEARSCRKQRFAVQSK